MADDLMALVRIRAGGAGTYLVTLADATGTEKEYVFTAQHEEGRIPVIAASPEFGRDVGPFGYSHLVDKAVSAFHEACQHPVGRPGWAQADE